MAVEDTGSSAKRLQCPLCGSKDVGPTQTYTSAGYAPMHCSVCDGEFFDPMKSASREWYGSAPLYRFDATEASPTLRWFESCFLSDRPGPVGARLLNIGCGKNVFLKRVAEAGYQVSAVDFSEKAVAFTREVLGIRDAFVADVVEFARGYGGERFDVITVFEVLEHVENPGEVLAALRGLLKPGGWLAASVPNRLRLCASREQWDYPPHHLSRWSDRSLARFLEAAQFVVPQIVRKPVVGEDILWITGFFFGTRLLEKRRAQAVEPGAFWRLLHRSLLFLRTSVNGLLARGVRLVTPNGMHLYVLARVANPS